MIIFDTETTGLVKAIASDIKHQPRIIEFAAIKLCDETLAELDRVHFLSSPSRPIPTEIVKITKITDKMVEGEKTFAQRIEELKKFFEGETNLIAHNLSFDKSMLDIEMKRNQVEDFPMPKNLICTIEQSFHLKGVRLNQGRLYEIATGGMKFEGAHRAINDVEALTKCVVWMIENNYIDIK